MCIRDRANRADGCACEAIHQAKRAVLIAKDEIALAVRLIQRNRRGNGFDIQSLAPDLFPRVFIKRVDNGAVRVIVDHHTVDVENHQIVDVALADNRRCLLYTSRCV